MGIQRVNGEIVFSAAVAVDKEQAKLLKYKMLDYQKNKMACDLGVKIAEEKGWYDYEDGCLLKSEIRLYVFTPGELKDFVGAKFKAKLQHMAATEEHLTPEQRGLLITQSERF